MELTPERIRSLVDEVTEELSKQGILSAAGARSRGGSEATAPAKPGAETRSPPASFLDYGNVAGRPGGYGGGFAGDDPLARIAMSRSAAPPLPKIARRAPNTGPKKKRGVVESLDVAAREAKAAHQRLVSLPLHLRARCIEAIRQKCRDNVQLLAELAVSETGMGRVEHKVQKNMLVIDQTPGIEDLEPFVWTGDHGMTLLECAPYGVIGAIGPSTNASETVINNAIGMIAGGNAVIFGPHPSAKRTCQTTVSLINEAVVECGGPENIITIMAEPSIESAKAMMSHKETKLLVVTGGPGVVREAMASGKKVIAAGPGNPPVVVDETADLLKAGRDIILGASLDNNVICTDEKEAFVVEAAAGTLLKVMQQNGAYLATPEQTEQLRKLVLAKDNGPRRHAVVNRNYVGRNASVILKQIGLSVPDDTPLIVCEVPPEHPFVWSELLMPVFPLARVQTAAQGMEWAVAAEHGFRHTASIFSKNIERLSTMAQLINCSIFVKNGPNYAGLGMGGEGPTSFTIASPTGEGMTTARTFTRRRRCTLVDYFRIV
jgi:acyl-CoA reductase-like NAD-dependent aldehyde dehydrogenase